VSAEGSSAFSLHTLKSSLNSRDSVTVNGWSSAVIQIASFSRKISLLNGCKKSETDKNDFLTKI